MALQIIYPNGITEARDKFEFLCSLKKALVEMHNQKGQDYKNGVITKDEWGTWISSYFEPRLDLIDSEMSNAINEMRNKYNVDVDSAIIE